MTEERNLLEKTLTARIDLIYKLKEELWSVMLDVGDFQNAVLNMAINAIHAMPGIGKLIISTDNIVLNATDIRHLEIGQGDYVLLSISDTGFGMDEETLGKLFDPIDSVVR